MFNNRFISDFPVALVKLQTSMPEICKTNQLNVKVKAQNKMKEKKQKKKIILNDCR